MSTAGAQYAHFILRHYFGPTATKATGLMKTKGPVLLLEILRDCSGVCALHIARFPLFRQLVLHFYGKTAEEILAFLFIAGRTTASALLKRSIRLHSLSADNESIHKFVDSLGSTFSTLMKTGVLQIVSVVASKPEDAMGDIDAASATTAPACEWSLSKEDLCEYLQKIAAKPSLDDVSDEPPNKRTRDTKKASPLLGYPIAPNIPIMEAMWRDRLIFQLTEERLGETCADILSRLLCIATAARRSTEVSSAESGGVSRGELLRSLREPVDFFDSYLSMLTEDEAGFVAQEPGIGGYMYRCPYKRVVRYLLMRHAEHVVQVLFQNSGLRIFRLLLLCGPLSHEEVERRVLLPQSDFRRTLPKMLAAGFVATTELSRSKEYSSETIFCLYSINLTRIARLLIELSQHAVLRLSLRAEHEFDQRRRMVDQRYRVETLIEKHQQKLSQLSSLPDTESASSQAQSDEDMRSQQKESLDALVSSITPAEQQQLDTLTAKLTKLTMCEQEAHTTWFIAELYLKLHSS